MYLLSHLLFFYIYRSASFYIFFFFNDTATTEIYTLSLHDALPISVNPTAGCTTNCASTPSTPVTPGTPALTVTKANPDRKSTRLNSSHSQISYAVFCLKKKKKKKIKPHRIKHTTTQELIVHPRLCN